MKFKKTALTASTLLILTLTPATNATPHTTIHTPQTTTTLQVPDIAWQPTDGDTTVTAQQPEPEPEPAPENNPEQEQQTPPEPEQQAEPEPANRATHREWLPPDTTGGILQTALQYQGVPYLWGGSTPAGFDCSGFTQYVYAAHGINLPRTSSAQSASLPQTNNPQPGDLVHWPGHVGIYAGNGMVIHAPTEGRTVELAPIWGTPTYHTR